MAGLISRCTVRIYDVTRHVKRRLNFDDCDDCNVGAEKLAACGGSLLTPIGVATLLDHAYSTEEDFRKFLRLPPKSQMHEAVRRQRANEQSTVGRRPAPTVKLKRKQSPATVATDGEAVSSESDSLIEKIVHTYSYAGEVSGFYYLCVKGLESAPWLTDMACARDKTSSLILRHIPRAAVAKTQKVVKLLNVSAKRNTPITFFVRAITPSVINKVNAFTNFESIKFGAPLGSSDVSDMQALLSCKMCSEISDNFFPLDEWTCDPGFAHFICPHRNNNMVDF